MPKPRNGESERDYVARCVPFVMGEGATREQALGKCYGMYRSAKKGLTSGQTGEGVAEARTVGGYESPEPGNIPEKEKSILAAVYAAARKQGYDKERAAKIAWGAVKRYRSKKKAMSIRDRIACAIMCSKAIRKGFQVDSNELYNGTLHEFEHTDDWREAMKIALDHLAENSKYYSKLREVGLAKSRKVKYGFRIKKGEWDESKHPLEGEFADKALMMYAMREARKSENMV